jgi:predicted kinase
VADYVVLVNGLPGAGKSTLAAELAPVLGLPLIAKDAIKEALAGALPGVPPGALGRAAAETMWELAAGMDGGVLLESWWFRPRDRGFAAAGLQRSGAAAVVEIWCDIPPEAALARFRARRRHEVYEDEHHAHHSWPAWAAQGQPLAIGQVVAVRTDQDVDVPALVRQVEAALAHRPAPVTRFYGVAARPRSPLPNAATAVPPPRSAALRSSPPSAASAASRVWPKQTAAAGAQASASPATLRSSRASAATTISSVLPASAVSLEDE